MGIRPRRVQATSLVASMVIVVVGLGGTPTAVSATSDSGAVAPRLGTAGADPAASAQRSERPELSESVPEDAVFLVAKRYGRGDSKRFRFRSKLFTVAFTCEARGRTKRAVVAVSERPSNRRCGYPNSLSVIDDRARQWVRVDAPQSVRWVMAVYEGTPDGITIS